MKKSYFLIIPLIVLIVAVSGSLFTSVSMSWYKTINIPPFAPSGQIIGTAWAIIFTLTAISAILIWNKAEKNKALKKKLPKLTIIFLLNGALNIFWTYLFFTRHLIFYAGIEALILDLSVLFLIGLSWKRFRGSAYLLIPYAVWVLFAAFLTFNIWYLNR